MVLLLLGTSQCPDCQMGGDATGLFLELREAFCCSHSCGKGQNYHTNFGGTNGMSLYAGWSI